MIYHLFICKSTKIQKEQLLPPETRRLGHSANEWQRRLSECDSLATLQEYATLVRQLRDELQHRSEATPAGGNPIAN